MERIIEEVGKEQDDTLKEYYGILIKLILEKNPRFIEIVRRERSTAGICLKTGRLRNVKISESIMG